MVAHSIKNDSSTRIPVVPLMFGLLLPVGALSHAGCRKDEPPPPMPLAESTPKAPLVLEIEDAGAVADNGDADADVRNVGYASNASMQACCAALQQNAASAPPPTNSLMMTAAAACTTAVAQGKSNAAISGIVAGALRGVGMPAPCGSSAPTPRPSRGSGSSV